MPDHREFDVAVFGASGFTGAWIAVAAAFFAFVRYSRTYEDQTSRGA